MYDILIIGGGVAGMQAAITAKELNLNPIIIEKDVALGGKVAHKYSLFPTMGSAQEVIDRLTSRIEELKIEVKTMCEVQDIDASECNVTYHHMVGDGVITEQVKGKTVLIATGYEVFDAKIKQEYGYGIYDNVYTSIELEQMMREGKVQTKDGKKPETIAFLHCVGSRDSQIGNEHCSRVCCVTGVKQAIEVCQMIPNVRIFNFYMDMRMFGIGYEEMYKEAQQRYQVRFIRGRVSELGQTMDKKVRLKAEDTLVARPIAISVDMVVLLVGMCGAKSNRQFANSTSIDIRENEFLKPINAFDKATLTKSNNLFLAGCSEAPKNVSESVNQATQAVVNINKYLLDSRK